MTEQPDDQPPAAEADDNGADSSAGDSGGKSSRIRLWRRTAGAAAVVAVLVVGNATVNSAPVNAATRTAGAGGSTTSTSSVTTSSVSTSAAGSVERKEEDSAAALHGEFRVINRDGSAQLRRWQSGAVNAIDQLSMTVRSADGFDSTYLLGPGVSVTGINLGDEVTVVGAGQSVPGNG